MQVQTSISPIASIDSQHEQICQQQPNAIDFYELAVAADETITSNYWHLGVAYLLAGREDDAQATWLTPLFAATEIDTESLTDNLIGVLEQAAQDRAEVTDLQQAWLLRQHIQTFAPDRVENILHLICLTKKIGTLTTELLIEWQVNELLQTTTIDNLDEDLLERALGALITINTDPSLEIIKSCLKGLPSNRNELITTVANTLFKVFNQQPSSGLYAVKLAELCNDLQPNTLSILEILNYLYTSTGSYHKAIETAEQYCRLTLSSTSVSQLFANYQLQRTHFTAGNWQKKDQLIERHQQLLKEVIQLSPYGLDRARYQRLAVISFFLPYIEDNPRINKSLQNQLVAIYQQNIPQTIAEVETEKSTLLKKTGCLRIGYIGMGLTSHSVGWLSRWLIHHHDRQSFQVFLYCLNTNQDDTFNHQWFRDKVDIT
jgi:predicted O-linked N-acetylglucosamine transferase (SPINDLY family)